MDKYQNANGYDLEQRIRESGWEYFGNVNERRAIPQRDTAFLVFEDGRAFRRQGYPSETRRKR